MDLWVKVELLLDITYISSFLVPQPMTMVVLFFFPLDDHCLAVRTKEREESYVLEPALRERNACRLTWNVGFLTGGGRELMNDSSEYTIHSQP